MKMTSRGRRRWSFDLAGCIAIAILIGGCTTVTHPGGMSPPPSTSTPMPTTSGSTPPPDAPTPGAAGHQRLGTEVLGKPGGAILLQAPADGAAPLRFLVAGAGEREVARITNPIAGVEAGWIRSAVANEAGLAAIVTEVPDVERRLLVYDLNAPTAPVHEAPGQPWHALGPRGLLVIGREAEGEGGQNQAIEYDFATEAYAPALYTAPSGVQLVGYSGDGSGLIAVRPGGDGAFEAGTLGRDGSFVVGNVHPLFVTGLERFAGPAGETLVIAHGDGQGWSSMSIAARRAGSEVVWYESRSDRGDPEPTGVAWDPAGRGLWIALTTPTEIRLALFREPARPTVIASVPRSAGDAEAGPPTIVGIHPGGGTIALGRRGNGEGADVGPTAHTILIDVETGAATEHEAGFVGWANWSTLP